MFVVPTGSGIPIGDTSLGVFRRYLERSMWGGETHPRYGQAEVSDQIQRRKRAEY